jgi:hypothetical protein
VVGRRRIGTGLVALGLTLAPVVTTATRAHAQISDAEGADGGDVSGGDGGAGTAGVLPNGNQNNALPGDSECFSAELCSVAGSFDDGTGDDPFATDAFADDA